MEQGNRVKMRILEEPGARPRPICDNCGKSFAHRRSLNIHQKGFCAGMRRPGGGREIDIGLGRLQQNVQAEREKHRKLSAEYKKLLWRNQYRREALRKESQQKNIRRPAIKISKGYTDLRPRMARQKRLMALDFGFF